MQYCYMTAISNAKVAKLHTFVQFCFALCAKLTRCVVFTVLSCVVACSSLWFVNDIIKSIINIMIIYKETKRFS